MRDIVDTVIEYLNACACLRVSARVCVCTCACVRVCALTRVCVPSLVFTVAGWREES
jgi:hypothetical protein